MKTDVFQCCFLILMFGLNLTSSTDNVRPIIGVLTEPTTTDEYGQEYVQTSYVKYLEMAGARVVAVRGDQPEQYYETLFNKINGVFFPGGSVDIDKGPYARSGKFMYDLAIKANDNGDHFPLWGTCLGFQLLTALTSSKDYLQRTDTNNMTMTLNFSKDFQNSKLFKDMPQELITILKSEPVTQNEHNWSMLLKDFYNLKPLSNFYKVLSTNIGRDGVEFVSTFEAINYPFYGIQWHPEKNVFTWGDHQVINHSFNGIKVAQYFANFFVNEARKNSHQYESRDAEAKAVIDNALRVFVPDFNVPEKFYFDNGSESMKCTVWIKVFIIFVFGLIYAL
ncbi:hypothetical protein Btru_067462 [Bulinus truncatus]|nr:hypothetical protein Btru_067462 [Bulinus truncatus]